MSALLDTYRDVQDKKENPWAGEIPAELLVNIGRVFREENAREISSAELKIVLDGVGWISRLGAEHDLSMGELMEVCEDIERNTRVRMERVRGLGSGEDALAMGVGAGFFTGLWLGLLLK